MPYVPIGIRETKKKKKFHCQPNLNWDAVQQVYRAAGDVVIGKPETVDVETNLSDHRNEE